MTKSSISLSKLCLSVKETLSEHYWEAIWVIAEISDVKMNRNGHCYLELIEKDPESDQIIARIKATIWSYAFKLIKPYFETTTGQSLTSGIKILIRGNIEFQEIYGLSFNIRDIDPNYTLGDLAQRRQQIIKQLQDEGVFEMNKELERPLVFQKIAIISSPTAAGYEDFINQLNNNSFEYRFYHKLFPAIMQGEKAEGSIISALETIYEHEHLFDTVAIIRGGGSTTDLLCFDSYQLALNITQFPIPILTGIGHDRDTSIADMVSHIQLKTPTAVAEFLINYNYNFDLKLNEYKEFSFNTLEDKLLDEKDSLKNLANTLSPLIVKHLTKQNILISKFKDQLSYTSKTLVNKGNMKISRNADTLSLISNQLVKNAKSNLKHIKENLVKGSYLKLKSDGLKLSNYEHQNHLNDPLVILQRGYSITYHNGKIVKDSEEIDAGEKITTQLKSGTLTSIVK